MFASAPSANPARDVVLAFIHHLNKKDFAAARELASDDLSLIGVMGSRQGAEAYFKDMERMGLKYDVRKAFAEGNEVCLLSDLTISDLTIFCCSWYRVDRGKIKSLRVVFDPRPLLEAAHSQTQAFESDGRVQPRSPVTPCPAVRREEPLQPNQPLQDHSSR